MRFRVWGVGLRVWGVGSKVEGIVLGVEGLGIKVQGSGKVGIRVEGLGGRLREGLGVRVED